MSARDELLDAIDGYLAGTLAGDGLSALERRLRDEPASRRLFWAAVNHEVLLRQFPFSASDAQPAPLAAPTITIPRGWWRRPRLALAACAALLLAALGLTLLPVLLAPRPIAHIAMLSAPAGDSGVLHRANGIGSPLRDGLAVHDGERIVIATGASLDLRFVGEGTTIALGSGTTAILGRGDGGTSLHLSAGTLNAEVAPQAPGRRLSVVTPQATVEVVGTRFAISAGDARTSIEVEEGRVRVAALGATGEAGAAVELGAGGSVIAEAGRPLAQVAVPDLSWPDRRPLGVIMLSRERSGWATNPRGWLDDPAVDITTPAGLADLHRRLDERIDQSIANLRAIDAQGLVFWDLEGLEHPVRYVGDPRQLGTLAPEMDAVVDRLMARVRAAGLATGVVIRIDAVERTGPGGALEMKPARDPAALALARIAYARQRWGATLFPLLGLGGEAMSKATICRRVLDAAPGILLMPTALEGDAGRWSAPWLQPGEFAQRMADRQPGAFAVIAPIEDDQLAARRDELVRTVAAGDVLTVRAWFRSPGHQLVKEIHDAARAMR